MGWGELGRYYILDVERKFCFVVGWGGVGWDGVGWDGEVLHFGCRAQILFCGGVRWGGITFWM